MKHRQTQERQFEDLVYHKVNDFLSLAQMFHQTQKHKNVYHPSDTTKSGALNCQLKLNQSKCFFHNGINHITLCCYAK